MRHTISVVQPNEIGARALMLKAAAAAFAVGLALPVPALAGGPTGGTYDLVLTAQVRDFPSSNPDFCKPTTIGQNWVEGSVAPTLNAYGRPVYTGTGRRVTVPANDRLGRNIATSLVNNTVLVDQPDVILKNAPTFANAPKLDTYNPNMGPYNPLTPGPAPEIGTGQVMPTVTVPNITPYVTDYIKQGLGSGTLNSSFRCAKFVLENAYTLTVQGNVTIVVDELLAFQNGGHVLLAPGATLTIYALKDATFQNSAQVNMNTGDPTRFTLYLMGINDVMFGNSVDVCGTIISPQGRVYLHNDAELYGDVIADRLHMQNIAKLHVPEPKENACVVVNDTPAQMLLADSAAVSSAASFDTWFNDTPGVNMDAQARLLFQKQPGDVLTFSSDDFRPIDGELMGANTWEPNRNFTLEMNSTFTYNKCTGQFFEFTGDGDAFVFIDGKLVLEMAGNNSGVKQHVDIDRLNLDPAKEHTLQFFYAQRSCSPSKFKVRTSVELRTEYTVEAETVAIRD